MKKIIFLIVTILLFSIAVFAQTDLEKPSEWKTLAPKTEDFSVDAPDNLKFSVFYNDDANNIYDKNENRRFSGMADKTYFFILSDISVYDPQFKTTLKFIEINQRSELEKQKSSKTMKFKFSDDESFFHTIYAVKTKNRSYIFHSVSENENDPNVERFFKSLKINKKSASAEFKQNQSIDKKTGVIAQEPVTVMPENKKPVQTGLGTGSGQGNGQGSGVGNGIGSGSQSSENKTYDTKMLNITFKPKPKYTEFGRFYEITGNIRMRTTFLKDGTIGSTIPVTKLPFGLTKSSIYAARQMRFEPQITDGKPVSVTKVVVFNFTIY